MPELSKTSVIQSNETPLAPGARVVIRDAEWLVRRVDRTSNGKEAVFCVGLSEIVREKEAVFLAEIEKEIQVLKAEETKLVQDKSRGYSNSLVYLESLLRQSPPTDERLCIGHKGAMDMVPYQMDPAIQALKEPRQRILIADAVGLGKTIECGILLAELIKRGRGKRILVLAVKSMLTQFQKELWARFTIPLVRLDSIGIQRIRTKIPTNHNPFYYYDKAIISIDTLKQEAEYRTYIENSYWDIIVIDEAHNVAERGTSSMRSKLARLLSSRSDTLIMLSATPHDGKKRSFASIMNMLNPTAITNPEDYGPEDIRGLFIRRFKKDIKDQVAMSFKERKISRAYCKASSSEESVFGFFSDIQFTRLDQRSGGSMLFKTTLEKALFSSPAACADTIRNRIKTLRSKEDPEYDDDIKQLTILLSMLSDITPDNFSKYRKLIDEIKKSQWTGKDTSDRLVVFTERIETLRFLEKYIPDDLGLKPNQVASLYGSMSDMDQQDVVERFGGEADSIRLLLASDVASEGINLHYLCHRMIHFDIPWSLMVFQQRNGRIDRYGQTHVPLITYLITDSDNHKIKGDMRILELLTEKDEQVVKNIGDPSEFTGIYDHEEEEARTADAIEKELTAEQFDQIIEKKEVDPLAILMGELDVPTGKDVENSTAVMPSLFNSDFEYLSNGLQFIARQQKIQYEANEIQQFVALTVPEELERRLRFLPPEIEIHEDQILLSADRNMILEEIAQSRTRKIEKTMGGDRLRNKKQEENAQHCKQDRMWPKLHLLWEQHPVVEWINDKVLAAFRRHEAPVITISNSLKSNESIFVVSGLIPNRKSHPLIHRWFGIRFQGNKYDEALELDDVIRITGLGQRTLANPGDDFDFAPLESLLPTVVDESRKIMTEAREEWETINKPKLQEHLTRLDNLRDRRFIQLEFDFGEGLSVVQKNRRDSQRREIDKLFDEYKEWIKETMTTEDKPYLRIAAVLWGGN